MGSFGAVRKLFMGPTDDAVRALHRRNRTFVSVSASDIEGDRVIGIPGGCRKGWTGYVAANSRPTKVFSTPVLLETPGSTDRVYVRPEFRNIPNISSTARVLSRDQVSDDTQVVVGVDPARELTHLEIMIEHPRYALGLALYFAESAALDAAVPAVEAVADVVVPAVKVATRAATAWAAVAGKVLGIKE